MSYNWLSEAMIGRYIRLWIINVGGIYFYLVKAGEQWKAVPDSKKLGKSWVKPFWKWQSLSGTRRTQSGWAPENQVPSVLEEITKGDARQLKLEMSMMSWKDTHTLSLSHTHTPQSGFPAKMEAGLGCLSPEVMILLLWLFRLLIHLGESFSRYHNFSLQLPDPF